MTTRKATSADLLQRFGLVAEEDFARMLGVSVKTLKNRPREKLPAEVVKIGGKRFFKEQAVRQFLDAHTIRSAA